jgi:hypothetical protein
MQRMIRYQGSLRGLAGTASAQYQGQNTYVTMEAETGCKSKYSEAKKADIFEAKYQGKQMVVTGRVAAVINGGGQVHVKVLPETLTYDVSIDLNDAKSGYNLEKDQSVSVRFVVKDAGGCIMPYIGDQGSLLTQ